MRRKKQPAQPPLSRWQPADLGLAPDLYALALRYLFDRPVPQGQQQEWYWDTDLPPLPATPLEWTRIQTALFANAGRDLAPYADEQVGMGLNFVMNNAASDVPFAAVDASVPLEEAMRLMRAMPALWRDGIGPRLAHVHAPIGSSSHGRLGFVCYMWFDVWPTFWQVRDQRPWRDAMWHVLSEMLAMPYREVQISALHGIGHHIGAAWHEREIVERALDEFVRRLGGKDEELERYAKAARSGCVQ